VRQIPLLRHERIAGRERQPSRREPLDVAHPRDATKLAERDAVRDVEHKCGDRREPFRLDADTALDGARDAVGVCAPLEADGKPRCRRESGESQEHARDRGDDDEATAHSDTVTTSETFSVKPSVAATRAR
jgi:hypothetical protein